MVSVTDSISSRPIADIDYSLLKELAEQNGDRGYADFVTQMPFSHYVQRVQDLGFTGMERVIDVGCGFGQWAAALALFNSNVVALECHEKRLAITQKLARNAGMNNIETCLGSALQIPFEDETFDALFCYGVLMFMNRGQGLQEFRRVLRPNGKLYICTNGFGWWLQTWFKNIFGNAHVRKSAWTGMLDKNGKNVPNCTNIKDVDKLMREHGFELLQAAPEGTISFSSSTKSMASSAYTPKVLGFDNVIEYVAKKKEPNLKGLK